MLYRIMYKSCLETIEENAGYPFHYCLINDIYHLMNIVMIIRSSLAT